MKRLILILALGTGCIIEAGDDGPGDGPFCGDGVLNAATETCDDGNQISGDGCSATCATEMAQVVCGDNVISPPTETCDDGNQVAGDGCSATCMTEPARDAVLTAFWQLKNIANNQQTGCPVGYDTAAVYSQPVNAMGQPAGSPIIDLFNCGTNMGMTAPLPAARYQVWIEITNTNNTSVYAKSLSAIVDLTTSDKTFSAQILNDGGYFELSWLLRGAQSNNALTCAQAGAGGGLEAIGTDISNPSNSASDLWNCEDGSGITGGFLAATYTMSIAALNTSQQSIGTAPTLTNRVINNRNAVTDLGTVTIPITGL
ncbi:MAG TPA: DUF4215 domain-containing protein [Kofleriaceae bacterium]